MKWLGHGLRGLVLAFLLYDVLAKLLGWEPIASATTALGFSRDGVVGLAVFEALVMLPSLVPRTMRLGLLLLTCFLSAAVAAQVTAGHSMAYRVFPLIVLSVLWTGHVLVDWAWLRTLLCREASAG